ncbi:MAG: hypothetical protein Q9O62_09830 [Ardenticatenia bacterium]|nr:hypothetical protein [Ardenticatenia bacterium]
MFPPEPTRERARDGLSSGFRVARRYPGARWGVMLLPVGDEGLGWMAGQEGWYRGLTTPVPEGAGVFCAR